MMLRSGGIVDFELTSTRGSPLVGQKKILLKELWGVELLWQLSKSLETEANVRDWSQVAECCKSSGMNGIMAMRD